MEGGSSSKTKGKATMNVPMSPLPAPNGRDKQANSNPSRRGRPPIPPSPQPVSVTDQFVPIANVIRIMRKALPPHAKISDEAKFAIQESVTEFISFVTEEANQRCRQEQRKTITGEDLLCAMQRLGFDEYVAYLTRYLEKYRDMEGLNHPRRQVLMYRPSSGTQYAGSLMPGPAVMVPNVMPMNPNNYNNAGMIAPKGQMPNGLPYEPGSSSASQGVYVLNHPTNSDGSLISSIPNRIDFGGGSCIHDEVQFDPIELPGDASPSGSTSANFMAGSGNDSFDTFAPFK